MTEDQATMIAQAFLTKAVFDNVAWVWNEDGEKRIQARAEWLDGTGDLDLAHDPGWTQDRDRTSLDLLDGVALVRCLPGALFALGKDRVSFQEVRGRGREWKR